MFNFSKISLIAAVMMISTSAFSQNTPSESRAHHLNVGMLNSTVRIETREGFGSGTVFHLHSGNALVNVVLTNAHVVEEFFKECEDLNMKPDEEGCRTGLPTVKIKTWITEGSKVFPVAYTGTVIMSDVDIKDDLAVVVLDKWVGSYAEPLPDANALEQSDDIFVAGSPLGENSQITHGMVSLLDDERDGSANIVVSATIIPGNSGGGLYKEVDGRFYFAGVPSAIAMSDGDQEMYEHGFVINLDSVKKYLTSLAFTF